MWASNSTAPAGSSPSGYPSSLDPAQASRSGKDDEVSSGYRNGLANGNGKSYPAPSASKEEAEEPQIDAKEWMASHPNVLEHFDAFAAAVEGKRLAVFLDYDGTLSPIVANPDEALMPEEAREAVRAVARVFPTAIISGRARNKVHGFVQLNELFYAGSHGMDIAGPPADAATNGDSTPVTFQPAAHFRPLIDNAYETLQQRLANVAGATVEHNTFCISAHYRNCQGDDWQEVVNAVEDIVSQHSDLRITRGRKVVEVRPKVDWHKGTALAHLVEALGLAKQEDVVAIYVGDDHTDEDAFRTLEAMQSGFGVLVSTIPKPTAARYVVRDPSGVHAFLRRLVEWSKTPSNAWHARPYCNGWRAAPQQ